ncbi:MAG: hypothetical protein PHY95_03205 [Candidatus ainarchaeum sp.]|nr:hypothetical protein [Candidatus ainarchaeum sp.]
MRHCVLLIMLAILVPAILAQEGYVGSTLAGIESAGPESSTLAQVAANWRVLSILVVMLSVGLVAIAYAIANAFSLPDLKAWADVEKGELFTSVIIVISLVGILVFVEGAGMALAEESSFRGMCREAFLGGDFCPAVIARSYLDSYAGAAEDLYKDLSVRKIEKAQDAYRGHSITSVFLLWEIPLYLGTSFREWDVGYNTYDVEMYDQELQMLGTMLSTIYAQRYIINALSLRIAPLCLVLGIVLRSFFLTRKLGGLLMAFGVGFLLVFPASYAIAYLTLQSTIYGNPTVNAGPVVACPEACTLPPIIAAKTGITATGGESVGLTAKELEDAIRASTDYAEDPAGVESSISALKNGTIPSYSYDDGDGHYTISSCITPAQLEACPMHCRQIPYPFQLPECLKATCTSPVPTTGRIAPACVRVIYFNETVRDDPLLQKYIEDFDICPEKCRTKIPKWGRMWDYYYSPGMETAGRQVNFEVFEECPPQCRWISTSNETDSECSDLCKNVHKQVLDWGCHGADCCSPAHGFSGGWRVEGDYEGYGEWCGKDYYQFPLDPEAEWAKGDDTPDDPTDDFYEGTTYIIPDAAFTEDCEPCLYVFDKGLAYKPQVISDCVTLCGAALSTARTYEDPATMTNKMDGLVGPTEMKSVAKLIIPAFVLPLFGLAITLMFIQSLSPMLGGDIDIPGMMRML